MSANSSMMYLSLKTLHLIAALTFSGGVMSLALVMSGWSRVYGVVLPHERSIGRTLLWWDHYVTVPAMLTVLGLGFLMAISGGWMEQNWLIGKVILAIVLTGLHRLLRSALKKRVAGDALLESSWYRAGPMIVTAALALIVTLAICKPIHS